MSTTQRSDLILPSILAEEISKGIAGMEVWGGSGVFTVNPGLQAGKDDVGNDRTVPYFESIGKAQEVPAGGALTPKKLSMSSETGTVKHIGDAVSVSGWAQRAKGTGRSVYDVAREQILAGVRAKIEDYMADALVARAVAAGMVYDGSAAIMSVTDIVELQKLFGDELMSGGGLAQWVFNSKPYWDAATLADSTGRPLFTMQPGEQMSRLGGAPVRMSDRSSLVIPSTSPQQYYNLAAKRAAGAVWFSADVGIESDRDSLADNDLLIYHLYLVVHAYGTMPGGTKCGVAAAKTR